MFKIEICLRVRMCAKKANVLFYIIQISKNIANIFCNSLGFLCFIRLLTIFLCNLGCPARKRRTKIVPRA